MRGRDLLAKPVARARVARMRDILKLVFVWGEREVAQLNKYED